MNTTDLLAHSTFLVEAAIDTRRKLRDLIDRANSIQEWLQANNLHPTEMSIRPLLSDVGFQIVYSLPTDFLLPFARVEGEFWRYVDELVMIDDSIAKHLGANQPLAGVTFDEHGLKVVVTPHPDAMLEHFPDHNFWESAALAEESIERERKDELFQCLVSNIREALDSEERGDHGATVVLVSDL